VAALQRALPLFLFTLTLTLPACGNHAGPDDPAITVPTGIPVGAPNAAGANFDAPVTRTPPVSLDQGKLDEAPLPLPKFLPPDPFDPQDLPEPKGHEGAPSPMKEAKPPKKGMQL
jgi:hypothetical protein